ncbi:hypothetical protein BH20GEM2_BH20GEM2_21910 [soil metagenome]
MPCLLVIAALLGPRIFLLVLWFLTDWFAGMFASLLWPVVGFLFLPTTLLWYSAVQHWFGGVWSTVPVIGLVVSLAIDVSPAAGRRG